MHKHVSYRLRRPGSLVVVRRSIAAFTLSAAGVFVLVGSQASAPLAFGQPAPTPEQGSLTLVSPTAPTWPTAGFGTPTLSALPTGAFPTAPASGPYGISSASTLTTSGIPQPAYRAYQAAATELARTDPGCKLHWSLIAGIGRVESNHGRYGGSSIGSDGVVRPPILGIRLDGSRSGTARISDSDGGRYDGDTSFDRAVGPMQFLPGTWKAYGAGKNPQDMNAAALATGKYLCVGSASLATQSGRWAAVYRYNHSDSYVSLVLSLADSYASGHTVPFPTPPGGSTPPASNPPATTPGPPPAVPSPPPSKTPTPKPTASPTGRPTASPTGKPTTTPTASPTTPSPTTTSPTTDPATPAPEPTTTPSPTGAPTPTPTGTCPPAPTGTPTPTPTASAPPTPDCPTPEPPSSP